MRRGLLATDPVRVIAIITLCLCGCMASAETKQGPEEETFSFVGDIVWIPLEGGFYGLAASDNSRYLPINLPDEFRKDGVRVRVRGVLKKNVATYSMWGTPIEIKEIEFITLSPQ